MLRSVSDHSPAKFDSLQYAVLELAWQVTCLPLRSQYSAENDVHALMAWLPTPRLQRAEAIKTVARLRDRLRKMSRGN